MFRYRRRYYLVLYIGLSSFEIILVLLQPWTQTRSQTQKREHSKVSRILQEFKKTAKKKKRKKRGNVSEGELKRGQPITRSRRRPAIDLPKEASKKRRMADSEQNLPKGKKGWSHHLFKRISWKKKQKEAIQVLATPKATEGTTFKELAPKNFVRDLRA